MIIDKKILKPLLKGTTKLLLFIILVPILYFVISIILTLITVNKTEKISSPNETIYLSTNGVHLDIIIQKKDLDASLLSGIHNSDNKKYISFGWGEENFYLNTPTWSDLTFSNAFKALFLKSTTLLHITRYEQKKKDWIEIKITKEELHKLNTYIKKTFTYNIKGHKVLLKNKGYYTNDDFYKATGSYSCLRTCNSWVNNAFKECGLKSCYWTPFDFGLLNKYK